MAWPIPPEAPVRNTVLCIPGCSPSLGVRGSGTDSRAVPWLACGEHTAGFHRIGLCVKDGGIHQGSLAHFGDLDGPSEGFRHGFGNVGPSGRAGRDSWCRFYFDADFRFVDDGPPEEELAGP